MTFLLMGGDDYDEEFHDLHSALARAYDLSLEGVEVSISEVVDWWRLLTPDQQKRIAEARLKVAGETEDGR